MQIKRYFDIITQISKSNVIKSGTVMVIPHTARLIVEDSYSGLQLVKQKSMAIRGISIFCQEAAA